MSSSSGRGSARRGARSRSAAVPQPAYEKSRNVLWAPTPTGVVLHNFPTGKYLELDADGERVWALLDGTLPFTKVLEQMAREQGRAMGPQETQRAMRIFRALVDGCFLQARNGA